jgi:hypothetical protein
MSRPEDVPESVWDAARSLWFNDISLGADVDENIAHLARAIMDERSAFLPALEAAESRLKIMAGMTGCRSDDDFVWEAQDLVDAALERARGQTGNTIEFIAKVISDHQPKPAPKLGGLTRQQRRAMDFIFAYVKQHDFAPSYQEIMEAMGLKSKSGVHRIVHALAERGAVEIMPDRARSIVVNHQYQAAA